MSPFSIAEAVTSADIAAVAGLFRAYAAALGVDLCFQNFEAELAGLPGKYAAPAGVLLLARDTVGAPLGCAALRPLETSGVAEMKRLYVAPEGRGRRLGTALLAAVLAEARRIGYMEIWLDTLPDMAAAQSIYRANGFEETPPYYDTPVEGTIFMRLTL